MTRGTGVTPRVISKFAGEWSFLSNFYQREIVLDGGITYPSAEHAFQAAKTDDLALKHQIAAASTSAQAKSLGRSVTLVDGWNEWRRYEAMEGVLAAKFAWGGGLASRLLETNDAVLIEGNAWHDGTWGICGCGRCKSGHNLLGWMLMRQRDSLREMT